MAKEIVPDRKVTKKAKGSLKVQFKLYNEPTAPAHATDKSHTFCTHIVCFDAKEERQEILDVYLFPDLFTDKAIKEFTKNYAKMQASQRKLENNKK